MSTGVFVEDGVETIEHIVENAVLERASVEPEPLPTEDSELLGYSKRKFPKRLFFLLAVITLFTVSALSTVAAGMDVTYFFVCHFIGVDREHCLRNDLAGAKVANFTAVGSVIKGVLSLVVTTYMSALSDLQGRRPLVITAMILTSFAHISSWYIVFHLKNPSTYWWLLLPTIIEGLGGGVQLVQLMCIAYISDMIRDPHRRAKLISMVDGCFFGSIALGPTIGSLAIRYIGIEFLYIATFAGALSAAFLSALFLGESLSSYHRRRNSTTRRTVRGSLDLLLFRGIEIRKDRRNACLLLFISTCASSLIVTFVALLLLYPKRLFGWTAVESGYMVSAMSTTRTTWFLIGFPYIHSQLARIWTVHSNRVDHVDVSLLRSGILFSVCGYLTMGYAHSPWHYAVGGIICASAALAMPIYKSAMLKYVPQGQFGTFMAGFNLINSLLQVFLPTVFLKLYSWSFSRRSNLPFEIVGAVFLALFFLTFLLKPAN